MSFIEFGDLKQEFGLTRFRDVIFTLSIYLVLISGLTLALAVIVFCVNLGYTDGYVISVNYNWLNPTVTFRCY